jgi:hypothetical protein
MLDLINRTPSKSVSGIAEPTTQNTGRSSIQFVTNNSDSVRVGNTISSASDMLLESRKVTTSTENPLLTDQLYKEKIINFFMAGGSLKTLSFDELVALSEIYIFSKDDLIEINDINFIKYLYENQIINFYDLPEERKKDIAILKYNAGEYESIEDIPAKYQTQEMVDRFFNACDHDVITCLKEYGRIFKFFSKELQTREMWSKILQFQSEPRWKYTIFYAIPKEFQTIELCTKLADNTRQFEDFHENVKTLEICTLYITTGIYLNLNLIPPKFIPQLQQKIIERITSKSYYGKVEGLELLPVDLLKQHPDIILHCCKENESLLKKLPAAVITKEMIAYFAKKNISCIPDQYIDINIILSRIATCNSLCDEEVDIINNHFKIHKQEIQQAAVKRFDRKNVRQLYKFVPDYLTEQQLSILIKEDVRIYKYLPDELADDLKISIIGSVLQNRFFKIDELNFDNFSKEMYQKLFDLFPPTPAWELDDKTHQEFIWQKVALLKTIPVEKRSLQIWLYLCNHNRENIQQIPEQLFTKDGLMFLVDKYIKINDSIDLTFIEYLFGHKFFDDNIRQKILQHSLQSSARSSAVFLQIIKSSKIPHDFKIELEKNMRAGELGFREPDLKELYAKTNPLQQAIDAPFATQLLSIVFKVAFSGENNIQLPKETQALKKYLKQPITELPEDITEHIFNNPVLVGGRTIQIDISTNEAMFCKFRKPGETLQEFANEGKFLEFLKENPEGKKLYGLLQSDIPKLEKMVRIPVDKLPPCAFQFTDGIDIFTDKNGIKYADMLAFVIDKNYYHYVHIPDLENPQNPYKKSEAALAKAAYDYGLLTGKKIYHTSVLPGYHDINPRNEAGRRIRPWAVLHMLFRYIALFHKGQGEIGYPRLNELNMTGKLFDWFLATSMNDIATTGIRDLGDVVILGMLNDSIKRLDGEDAKLFGDIKQMLVAANVVSEQLIALGVLFARLHFNDQDDHYRNEKCISHTVEQLKEIFSQYLYGRLKAANQPKISLQQFMQLSDEDYNNTFTRIATELVYWTANPNNSDDNFINHIKQRKLPEDLYDHYDMLDNPEFELKYSPKDLGRRNGTFPLLAYTNFTFLLNTRLLENKI